MAHDEGMWPDSSWDIVHNSVDCFIEQTETDLKQWFNSEMVQGSHNQVDDHIDYVVGKVAIDFLKANRHQIALMANAILELGPDKQPKE